MGNVKSTELTMSGMKKKRVILRIEGCAGPISLYHQEKMQNVLALWSE